MTSISRRTIISRSSKKDAEAPWISGVFGIEDLDESRWLRPSQRARVCATGPAILEALSRRSNDLFIINAKFVLSRIIIPRTAFFFRQALSCSSACVVPQECPPHPLKESELADEA